MSSILKVDQLQDSGGNNLVTSNGSGVITSAGFGKVGQVVSATDSTTVSTTSTSFVTASNNLLVNITPSSTSSKIFILATGAMYSNAALNYAKATIYRNGTTNLGSSVGMSNLYNGGNNIAGGLSLSFLDSPATTSETTYQVYFLSGSSSVLTYLNINGAQGSITAMEILP